MRISLLLPVLLLWPHPAFALLCGTFLDPMTVSVTDLNFGTYLAGTTNTAGTTVKVSCTLQIDLLQAFRVTLSAGNSGDPGARRLQHGGDSLNYNIFTDGGYGTAWGDGTNGSMDQGYDGLLSLGSRSFTGWGKLPKGQYVPAGTYGDRITVTVTY